MISPGNAMVPCLMAATVLTGMVKYTELSETAAFSQAFSAVGRPEFAKVVAVRAIVGIITVLFSFTLGASRIWYSISRDGLLPAWFPATNKHHSPSRPVWIVGVGHYLGQAVLYVFERHSIADRRLPIALAAPPVKPTPADPRG